MLTAGSRLGSYEILSAIGTGGMSACGYAALAAMRSRQRRISVRSRRGWGPGASENMLAAIGAGGMGEVNRARDTRLRRDVAIKVLPDLFEEDPERLARFECEAQLLASLNHPQTRGHAGEAGWAGRQEKPR